MSTRAKYTPGPATGAAKFKAATTANVGRQLAIVLDNHVSSAPVIRGVISDDGQISGRFTAQEADELAKVLRAGALPATLNSLQELTVGASLGKDSVRAGVTAAVAGMLFLATFMLVYYRFSGLNAVVALSANLRMQSGWPWSPIYPVAIPGSGTNNVFLEDIDNNYSEMVTLVDIRLEKAFSFGGKYKVTGLFDVYNLFNSNADSNFVLTTGRSFNNIIAALDPRAIKIGARFQF